MQSLLNYEVYANLVFANSIYLVYANWAYAHLLNANLVLLNSTTIPESILEEMLRTVEILNKNTNLVVNKLTTMNKILEGTPYEKGNISITSSVLNESDESEDDDFSFITDKKEKGKLF